VPECGTCAFKPTAPGVDGLLSANAAHAGARGKARQGMLNQRFGAWLNLDESLPLVAFALAWAFAFA